MTDNTETTHAHPAGPWTLALTVLGIVGFLALCGWSWSFTMDDAFISFRYAKHIANGIGPVWNLADHDNPVEGFTSFLHVWTLGLLYFVTGADLPLLGKVVGITMGVLVGGYMGWIAKHYHLGIQGGIVGLSFLWLPYMALNAVSGMETMFFVLWNILCVFSCIRLLDEPSTSLVWQFVFLGLVGTLTRPEFGAPFLLMVGYVWWQRPGIRPSLFQAFVALYILPGITMTLGRYLYYGDFLPNPFYVKQRLPNAGGIFYVARFLGFFVLPYMLLAAPGLRTLWKSNRNLVVIIALNVGLACLYFSSTRPLMGWWYRFLLPQVPLLAFLAAMSIDSLRREGRGVLSVSGVTGVVLLGVITLAHLPIIQQFLTFHYQNEVRYREVGKRLHPFSREDRWMVFNDVGSLVFESEWNTVDVVGLNTRKQDLKSPCVMRTDLIIKYSMSQDEIPNPCQKAYRPILDVPFLTQHGFVDSYMRFFVRKDVGYSEALKQSLLENWPAPFVRPPTWLVGYWDKFHRIFWY